jgi:hypothetical protein
MMKHPLKFVQPKGKLADALGLTAGECRPIELIVERCIAENKNFQELLAIVGDLDISDELWANFLYTYGWWDGRRQ